MLPDEIADRHRAVCAGFGEVVAEIGVDGWDAPTPVEGWTARDVVLHLVTWNRAFLADRLGRDLPPGPDPVVDPAAGWAWHAGAVQSLLDDPGTAQLVIEDPYMGTMPLADLLDRAWTGDVFLHTWDLARAAGIEPDLDRDQCAAMLAGMAEMEELLRAPGLYGPAVPVPDDADVRDRLAGFIGRDPSWQPPSRS